MKNLLILFMTLFTSVDMVMADEVKVADVTLPKGSTAQVSIELTNPEKTYTAGQMVLVLPEGISAVLRENGNPTVVKGERFATTQHSFGASHKSDGTEQFTIFSSESEAIPGTSGILLSAIIQADEELEIGTQLIGTLKSIELSTTDAERVTFDDITFNITIGEPQENRILLDETSTTVPTAATDVNVRLNRTIKANTWSTLVLPFSVSAEQVKAAWGDDAEVAEFTSWSSEEDEDGAIVGIAVGFTSKTDGIKANTPVIVRTSADYTTAIFDGVTLEPEENPTVQVGRKAAERGWFHGTYTMTQVPEENIFLSGNKFWYSTGETAIMGYRGYFEFRDVLDAYYDAANVKFQMFVDGVVTGVNEVNNAHAQPTDAIYNLSGQRMARMQHGMNIVNGKKILK